MNEEPEPAPCSCAIDCFPATTSIIGCAEHGMPQNLQDTEFPGSTPKVAALFIDRALGHNLVAVAPLYSHEQVAHAIRRGEELGLQYQQTTTIYSLADLERAEGSLPQQPDFSHEPGCIYSHTRHPGKCYIPSETYLPSPGDTHDGDPAL